MRLPPLNALRAFSAASRHLSFTKAANELNVTQAAVSHQIKTLEDWLGVPLFRRQNRQLFLTDAGQAYRPVVRDAFEAIAAATERLTRVERSGALTVSVFTSFAAKWLLPRLGRFTTRHPDIEVRLSINDAIADPTQDGYDVGIRYGRGNWPRVIAERFLTEQIFVVCSPKLLDGPNPLRTPADLAKQTLLHDDLPEDWGSWLKAAGVEMQVKRGLEFNHSEMVLQAAADGLGVALGRSALVADDLAAGRLVKPFDLALPADGAYWIVYADGDAERPRVQAFRDWVFEEADSSPREG